jgi:hypothetical protein
MGDGLRDREGDREGDSQGARVRTMVVAMLEMLETLETLVQQQHGMGIM